MLGAVMMDSPFIRRVGGAFGRSNLKHVIVTDCVKRYVLWINITVMESI
jgi:hypothetical protein